MRNNRGGLDEMQREWRDRIGNQMFMLMFYALLVNSALYGYGVRWLDYPVNVMVITTACMAIYLVRVIAHNAYLPAKAQNRRAVTTLVLTMIFSITLAITAVNLFGQPAREATGSAPDHSAVILFVVSSVGLLATIVAAAIKAASNRADRED